MIARVMSPAAAALACAVVSGCGGSVSGTPVQATSPSATATTTADIPVAAPAASTPAPPAAKPKPKPKPRPKPNPGSLPQTDQLPSASTASFRAEMAALWRGVVRNSLVAALPAFFPEGAYAQVKQIPDASGDYANRLLVDYRLDLEAAHMLLGSDPAGARLVEVRVPGSYAHWVNPGACYNTVGYYEVPNARVVYRQDAELRSFGIASMISWRGVWYIVHLGAILRTAGGVVDDPSPGAGESTPSSTC